jgi:hypothetical protein
MNVPDDSGSATAEAFRLFHELAPPEILAEFDVGHVGVFSPWVVVWLMIFQRLHGGASTSRAVAELKLGAVSSMLPDCKRVREDTISVATGGYCQARSALDVRAAEATADAIFESLTSPPAGSPPTRRSFLLDGTTLSLERRPELLDAFPPASNQHGASHWPILHMVALHDLATGCAMRPQIGAMYGLDADSEVDLARRLLDRLGQPVELVADRNFGVFAMAHAATRLGHDVLFRLTDARFGRVLRLARPVAAGEWRVDWTPSRWDRDSDPALPGDAVVHGRLIEILVERDGEPLALRLFTTDLESTPAESAARYMRRWDVETDLRSLKCTLGLDRPAGRGVDVVLKEIILGSAAYNLVIQTRRLAAARAGVEPRRLSYKRVLDLTQAYCDGLDATAGLDVAEARFDRLLAAAAKCRLPKRRRRSYPREVIQRRRSFPVRRGSPPVQKN